MQVVVFEDAGYQNLLPLVYTRATFNLRCGFDNLLDKIETAMGGAAAALFVRPAIAPAIAERQKRPVNRTPDESDQLWVNGRLLVRRSFNLPVGAAAWHGDTLLAARVDRATAARLTGGALLEPRDTAAVLAKCTRAEIHADVALLIDYPWQLVHENEKEIVRQFAVAATEQSGRIYPGASLVNPSAIHVGAGAKVKPGVVLDAEDGPIYVGANAIIQPNAVVVGPCFIGERCVIQPGASIRGGCSIHMVCKVGGEVEGTIFHGYSNKQHDGFLGHSYVGEWVNLGADTVNSDLKNTYGPVQVAINGRPVDSGHAFVGSFIGDHVKTGINTALPTGCVVGFASSVFVGGLVPKFVPSFSWLTDEGRQVNEPPKALAVARRVVARRGRTLSAMEEALFLSVMDEARRCEEQGP